MITIPRLVIAGTHSGVGKTTVATALMAALNRRGLKVQPFKVGPDFIDPTFHTVAAGRISRNLDGWMLTRETNLETLSRACRPAERAADISANLNADPKVDDFADVAVIEGVMGLFDGRDATTGAGSTAEMAAWLNAPVLLVVDASAMARSVAALARGFEEFDPQINVAGVLCNRVGGDRHAVILGDALRASCRAAPLGFLPRNEKIALPERHLGLRMAGEALTPELLAEMARWIEGHVNLDDLLAIARERAQIIADPPEMARLEPGSSGPRIGVARDAAFCFYYQDNLDLLAECGAKLVEFSPIADARLPGELDGLYLGGGYPELHAQQLSGNCSMRKAVVLFAETGAPIYAECGGFMYLTEAIVDTAGREHPMAGLFPTRARMQNRLAALAYIEAEAVEDTLWLQKGQRVRGHEFRYSDIDGMAPGIARRLLLHSHGETRQEGYAIGSVLGGYAHLHFRSSPDFAARFVRACSEYKRQSRQEGPPNA